MGNNLVASIGFEPMTNPFVGDHSVQTELKGYNNWQRMLESNQRYKAQNLVPYHLANPQLIWRSYTDSNCGRWITKPLLYRLSYTSIIQERRCISPTRVSLNATTAYAYIIYSKILYNNLVLRVGLEPTT